MSADIELESAKWLSENLVVCTLCESSTFHMSEDCNHCQAPLSISTTISSSEVATHFIPIIGVGGVGKTTYTAMLLELLRHGSNQIQTKLTRASTRALQRRTLKGLFDRKFPPPTSNEASDWDWVFCEVSTPKSNEPRSKSAFSRFMSGDDTVHERELFNWICPDVPGHAVEQAINHEDYCPVVIKTVAKANGIIVLIDATRADGDEVNEYEDELASKLAAFIGSNARCAGLNSVLVDVPVAIVFTKADRCRSVLEDPTQFAKRQLPKFFESVHSNIRHYEFFAASVAGGVARVHDDFYIPFQIQPKGVVEPFAWVIKTHSSDR